MSHTRLHPALHFSLTFVFPFRFVFWSQPASSWVVLWNAVQVTPTRPDRAGGLGKKYVDEASLAHPWAKCVHQRNMLTLMTMHAQCLPNTMHTWLLIYIHLSAKQQFSANKNVALRNLRELHVYLSRSTCLSCLATTPLIKIHLSPAKLRQRIRNHFFIAL